MNTGGPAFPGTLLDWYAGQALTGLCANPGGPIQANGMTGWGFANCNADYIAGTAYDLASAMLAEKARREATGKDSLQVPDHSPDAGKMAELQAANRELVEALSDLVELIEVDLLEQGFESSPSAQSSLEHSKAIITKHKGAA